MSSGENGQQPEAAIEGTAVEVPTVPSVGALVPTGGVELAVTPSVKAEELVERLEVIKQAQKQAMVPDVDYGVIPGTNKPTLLKPGAEKLSVLFQLDVQIVNDKLREGDHLTVTARATAYHAPTGIRLGYGEGICTTRERKYAYRQAKPKCPSCGEETIFRSKKDGEGWFCWKKKGGCGAQFAGSDQKITGQETGDIDNPDLPDLWNTVVKMAEKRARVDAVLAVTGASALFTQDVEDSQGNPYPERAGSEEFHRANAAGSKPMLDAEIVGRIVASITALKMSYGEIGLMLGAATADGLNENSAAGVHYAIERLTKDQVVKVEAHLEKVAQDKAAEQSQGGGGDGE